jgi:hypothetical protein
VVRAAGLPRSRAHAALGVSILWLGAPAGTIG